MRRLTVALALLGIVSAPERARAFEMPDHFLTGGLSVGLLGDGDKGLLLGAEASYVRVHGEIYFWGGFVDVRYDQANRGVMVALGPELFIAYLGVDLGLVLRAGRDGPGVGVRGRFCGSFLGVASLCGGGGITTARGAFGELTLLLKYPGALD